MQENADGTFQGSGFRVANEGMQTKMETILALGRPGAIMGIHSFVPY